MIRFTFQPNKKDLLAFQRHVWNCGIGMWLLIASVVSLIVFLASPIIFQHSRHLLATGQLYRKHLQWLFLPIWYLLVRLIAFLRLHGRFNAAKVELTVEREYTIDEEGIHIRAVPFSSDIKWMMFKLADCNRKYCYFKTGQNTFFYFPRVLIGDEGALGDLVRGKVKPSGRWRREFDQEGV